jgi:hypothetical protein
MSRREYAEKGLSFLFRTPINDRASSLIYVGEVDGEGYISWVPVEKNISHDLTQLEERLEIDFHPVIYEYFNSYWFAELDGFYNNHYIKLEAVLPNFEFGSFGMIIEGYRNNHNNALENIPIGIEGNGLLVVIDNKDGKVKLEDYERGSFEIISESIHKLISNLRLKR